MGGGSMDRCPAFFAFIFSIVGAILLIVALTGEKWIEKDGGLLDADEKIGLLKSCDANGKCTNHDIGDLDNKAWVATIALWIVSLILIFVGSIFVILAFIGIHTYKMFNLGNKIVYIGFILQAIGLIVYPVGYNQLGEPCEDSSKYGCGRNPQCEGDNEFDYFTLCSPFDADFDFIMGCVAVGLQMIGSILYGFVGSDR